MNTIHPHPFITIRYILLHITITMATSSMTVVEKTASGREVRRRTGDQTLKLLWTASSLPSISVSFDSSLIRRIVYSMNQCTRVHDLWRGSMKRLLTAGADHGPMFGEWSDAVFP